MGLFQSYPSPPQHSVRSDSVVRIYPSRVSTFLCRALHKHTPLVMVREKGINVFKKRGLKLWGPRWLSQLSRRLLALAQVMISRLWDRALCWAAVCLTGSRLQILSPPSTLCPPPLLAHASARSLK